VALTGPYDVLTRQYLAGWELDMAGDPRPLHQAIDSIRATKPAALRGFIAMNWLICALAERDAAAATEALSALDDREISLGDGDHIYFPRAFVEGVIARMINDEHKAQLAFAAARAEQEKIVQAQPDYAFPLCVLGLIDAALGRKEEALREGRRAVELLPIESDAIDGKYLVKYLAVIAAWVGEKDIACQQLAIAVRRPASLFFDYGGLKLLPLWDPLRGDPCFERSSPLSGQRGINHELPGSGSCRTDQDIIQKRLVGRVAPNRASS
jgi:serine/threonine-protein kinase